MKLCEKTPRVSDVCVTVNMGGAHCTECSIAYEWHGSSASSLIEHLTLHVNRGDLVQSKAFSRLWQTKERAGDMFVNWKISMFVYLVNGLTISDENYDEDEYDEYDEDDEIYGII